MKVRKIRENNVEVVINSLDSTTVARYNDNKGSYFYNEQLKKEYFLNAEGEFIADATYFEA